MTERTAVVIHRHRDRKVAARAAAPVVRLPWADLARPATPSREAAFVADLRILVGDGPRPHRRSDVTAVLNALRGGLTVERLLEIAPGLRPDRLLGAYFALEARRAASEHAWLAILDDPTALGRHGSRASRLLPVPVASLTRVAAMSPCELGLAVGRVAAAIDTVRSRIVRLERELETEGDTERASLLGTLLFDHSDRCVYADDHHLPVRVAALMPSHLDALLSECRRGDQPARRR